MFGDAAARLGVQLVFATDRCDHLDDPWADSAIPIRFHQEATSVDVIMRALERAPVDGVLAVGDRATVIAAFVTRLLGLPGHSAVAAATARDKRLSRERLGAAGFPMPSFTPVPITSDAQALARTVAYPCVVKPLVLSGSRGVMRANNPAEFAEVFERLRALLNEPDVRAMRDIAADLIQIESFIPGQEFALEGLLHHGELYPLALFDKPDPLDGPFFEETVYVTPSRAAEATGRAIRETVGAAALALGLHHGPIHAECRINETGVYVLEIAARPIGGLCAKALTFESPHGRIGLEEVLLRHALGERPSAWVREAQASGVMMIPIPRAGVYRRVEGIEAARAVPGITALEITAKADQRLVPLPEGASYLGFIFAKGGTPADVEQALRASHARLHFVIDREMPVL